VRSCRPVVRCDVVACRETTVAPCQPRPSLPSSRLAVPAGSGRGCARSRSTDPLHAHGNAVLAVGISEAANCHATPCNVSGVMASPTCSCGHLPDGRAPASGCGGALHATMDRQVGHRCARPNRRRGLTASDVGFRIGRGNIGSRKSSCDPIHREHDTLCGRRQ
jgi:hypothetical protein